MPQIWLDDDELAAFAGLSAPGARRHAIRQGWARMRSRSGTTRSRLPAEMTQEYLHFAMRMEAEQAFPSRSWASLRRALLALMPERLNAPPQASSPPLGGDARLGHSIAPTLLVSESRRGEAA